MSKESFKQLMNQYCTEAEELQLEETRLRALDARRERIKQSLISVLVAVLYAFAYFKHVEISDTVAKLFRSKEPEYQSIMAVNDEIDAEESGHAVATADSDPRKARLKDSLKKAKERTAVADQIMDDNLDSHKTATKKK